MSELLKLKAVDAEDIQVISAVLQDAIAPVLDMVWNQERKNFVMVVHRLRREAATEGQCPERIRCAINIAGVEDAKTKGIELDDPKQILDLLAMMPETDALQLVFAGEAKIRLELNSWTLIVEDFGEPWPASCTPCHDETKAAAATEAGAT